MAPSKNITKLYLHAPSGPTSQNHPGPCLSLSKLSSLLRCSSILPLDVVSIVPIHSPPSSADECVLSRTSSPVLYAADDTAVGGGGGNVLLKAVALMASVDITGEVEEWLEFEENVVVPALILGQGGGKAGDAALKILESKVKEVIKKGNYLVGESMTLADIALVTTLSIALSVTPSLSLGPSIKSYLAGHSSSLSSGDLSHLLPGPPLSTLSLSDAVSKVFASALELAFPQVESFGIKVDAKRCTNLKFGDYQCNNAMVLFKKLKESGNTSLKSPQNVAQQILQAVDTSNPVLDQLAVTGPGFIMCRIRGSFLSSRAQRIAQEGKVSPPVSSTEKRVVVDFSSPNIAKEMHVGHLRSTIIGESVCRILEYCGSKVMRVNHVGDWGTQFGMLIQYLKEEYPNFETDQPNITDLTMFYKNAKERFDKDADFKKISQLNVVALQSGDPTCLNIWKILCDISRIEFQKVYKRLDVSVEECGESFYNDKIAPVIKEFEEKKLISIEEGGAKCIFVGKKFSIPLMVQKSDGGYGYDSTDMAALKYRLSELDADRIVYITDFSQANHFHMCFEAAKLIGWVPKNEDMNVKPCRLDHIGFGTVQGEDGKRFKTRSGTTVRLVDLLDEAVARMKKSLTERISENKANIKIEEVDATAAALGYGAVKYFDLHRNPTSNYIFSYDRMLDTRGNTAIYLLYAHARLVSICTKAKEKFGTDVEALVDSGEKIVINHPSERNLAFHLEMFKDNLAMSLDDLFPYHICEYLYLTCGAASDFVTKCKVLGEPEMNSRLLLCHATAIMMRQCFDLLGIQYVMRV